MISFTKCQNYGVSHSKKFSDIRDVRALLSYQLPVRKPSRSVLNFWWIHKRKTNLGMQVSLQNYQKIYMISYTHWGKSPQFVQKFIFWKSYFSQNSQFQSLISHKIHNFKVPISTKFTISKSHFSQNSHFSNIKFLLISG